MIRIVLPNVKGRGSYGIHILTLSGFLVLYLFLLQWLFILVRLHTINFQVSDRLLRAETRPNGLSRLDLRVLAQKAEVIEGDSSLILPSSVLQEEFVRRGEGC